MNPSTSMLYQLQKSVRRLKLIIFVLFGIIAGMAYIQWEQNQLIKLVAIGTAQSLDAVGDQIMKNAEQDALIKQALGVDFEEKEKLLFKSGIQ